MLEAAESYFKTLSDRVEHHVRQRWEAEIVDAESRRLNDRAVMDILAARSGLGLEVTAAPSDEPATDMEEAMNLALSIEEKQ
jgi:hypothetical protein